jgi:hypothetical protein
VTAPFPPTICENPQPLNSPLNSVDTLLGLSNELWPIIHRLSQLLICKSSLEDAILAGESSKALVLKMELEGTSNAIEIALTKWKPSLNLIAEEEDDKQSAVSQSTLDNPDARMQSILNNAEAYRNSSFVYLHRKIHSYPRNHPSVQKHAHLSLVACSNVVKHAEKIHDGPMGALLWPLFIASCEASTEEDRDLALITFRGIERRQKMNNIMRAREVVQEVWKRVDLGDEEVDWMGICTERGYSIVLG